MNHKQLLSYTRKAIDQYHMIEANDHIAIGISGGKDSLTLLYALHGLLRFYPIPFSLSAITVDLGYAECDYSQVQALCDTLGIRYMIAQTDIAHILFDERKEKNPCSLCARMRKGVLNQEVKKMGCNKIAYAHHKDDIVETMLLSLLFEGRIHTFAPVTYLDRMDLTVIRPLLFLEESDIISFKNEYRLPVVKSKCPIDGYTKRQYAKELIARFENEHEGSRQRMFKAIQSSTIKGWNEQ